MVCTAFRIGLRVLFLVSLIKVALLLFLYNKYSEMGTIKCLEKCMQLQRVFQEMINIIDWMDEIKGDQIPDPIINASLLPIESVLPGYVVSRNNVSDIAKECDGYGTSCKGFTYHRLPNKTGIWSRMKISFGVPSESKEKSLYIKRSYIDLYINALKTDLTCAVPLTNLTAGNGGCKLPKLQKYYEEIMHLVKRLPPITCDVNHLHTKLEHGVLQMRENATKDPQVTSLHARPIRRGKNDDTITYGPPWHFNLTAKSLQVQEDFWEVISILKNKEENKNFHLSVVEKPGIERRMLNNNAPLNIMMMTLDSTSAVHFERMLPKTYDFLSQEFGSYVFKGFSVVGDGTAPYMSAVLTGRPWDENTKQWSEPDGTVDRWPFVFKKFEKKGFVTMFSEDFSHLDAHIDEQWCPCLTWIPVSTSHLQVVKAARKALAHINELLATNPSSRKLCHRLELKKVISAHQKMANMRVQDKGREDECSYQIQFEVRPSGGVFEALVKFFYSGEIEPGTEQHDGRAYITLTNIRAAGAKLQKGYKYALNRKNTFTNKLHCDKFIKTVSVNDRLMNTIIYLHTTI
ncbi:predicted protein [Nematostella vectensis]|uniref:Uncharacterized protein n=1 Tax=Nematostella vectensis TaxID=45351 RepID=A7SRS4_NEMVE|nr:predicted protein [Nematostella vectensis]|eukprot:XP_001625665.1 predicted protein [Nematostella vectensis]